MASTVSLEVHGLREMVRDLERVGVEVADLKDVFSRIADEAATTGKGFTPTGKTGALRASARGNRAKNKAVVMWGRSRVVYAGPVIYGWGTSHANYKTGKYATGIRGTYAGAKTIQKTDAVMANRAPVLLENGLGNLIQKYGF